MRAFFSNRLTGFIDLSRVDVKYLEKTRRFFQDLDNNGEFILAIADNSIYSLVSVKTGDGYNAMPLSVFSSLTGLSQEDLNNRVDFTFDRGQYEAIKLDFEIAKQQFENEAATAEFLNKFTAKSDILNRLMNGERIQFNTNDKLLLHDGVFSIESLNCLSSWVNGGTCQCINHDPFTYTDLTPIQASEIIDTIVTSKLTPDSNVVETLQYLAGN